MNQLAIRRSTTAVKGGMSAGYAQARERVLERLDPFASDFCCTKVQELELLEVSEGLEALVANRRTTHFKRL
jgi:hypothetical protein